MPAPGKRFVDRSIELLDGNTVAGLDRRDRLPKACLLLGRERVQLFVDGLDYIAAGGQVAQLRGKITTVPVQHPDHESKDSGTRTPSPAVRGGRLPSGGGRG